MPVCDVLGVDVELLESAALKETVQELSFQEIEVNRESRPVLQAYYQQGR